MSTKNHCTVHTITSYQYYSLKIFYPFSSSGCGTEGSGGIKPAGGLSIFICIRGGGNEIGEEGIAPGVVPRGGGGFWYSGLGGGG